MQSTPDHASLLAEVPELRELSELEQKAVIHYSFSGNKAEAVKSVGWGLNRQESAAQQGWLLFSKPRIIKALRSLNAYLMQGIQEEMAGLVRQILGDATYDNAEAYDQDGNLKNIHDIPPELRSRLLNYKQGRFGPEATWIDKSRAREFILNLFMTNQSASAGMTVHINLGEPTDTSAPQPEKLVAGQFVLNMTDKQDAQLPPPTNGHPPDQVRGKR